MKLQEPTFGAPGSPSIGHHWDQKKKLLRKIKNGMFLCAGDHDFNHLTFENVREEEGSMIIALDEKMDLLG